ncbi:MAG: alpha/beta hydrolase [Pseudomonadota bacterium]
MTAVFLHGVPDTSALWAPLVGELGLRPHEYYAPDLPGFGRGWPDHFVPNKDGYIDWLLAKLENLAETTGEPVDIVGHDWGAIFTIRLAALRPDLVRSWTAIDAVIQPDYRWHKTARQWQTPVLGELMMLLIRQPLMRRALLQAGVPAELATIEAAHWNSTMKRSILSLYRSAKTVSKDWSKNLSDLPDKGLVIFGEMDPYIDADMARAFAKDHHVDIHIEPGRGHWILAEDAALVASLLRPHLAPQNSLHP